MTGMRMCPLTKARSIGWLMTCWEMTVVYAIVSARVRATRICQDQTSATCFDPGACGES
jgi:hypothetical protein